MSEFKKGDKVKWQYTHWLNSKSWVNRVKKGVFVRKVRTLHVTGGTRKPITKYCMVHFDGNKGLSRVKISEVASND